MKLNVKGLAQRFDQRTVTDPWGQGWEFLLRRFDLPAWDRWRDRHIAGTGVGGTVARKMKRVGLEMVITRGLRGKGETDADALTDRLIERTSRALTDEEIDALEGMGMMNLGKAGLALFGLRDWGGLTDGGATLLCTMTERLKLLGYEGSVVIECDADEETGRGYHFLEPGEQPDKGLAKEIASGDAERFEFCGPLCDPDSGDAYLIPEGMEYGPATLSDALTQFLLAEAQKGQAYARREEAAASDFLPDTPAGESASPTPED